MAFTLEAVSQWLNEENIKHSLDTEREVISFTIAGNVRTEHFIRAIEDGELFHYSIQILDDKLSYLTIVKDHPHIVTVLQYILMQNYKIKFGVWEYNYNDGDIRFCIEVPLEDAQMTQKQFKRIFSMAYDSADTMARNIVKILENGKFPEDDSSEDLMRKLLLLKALMEGKNGSSEDSGSKSNSDDDDGI